MNAADKPAPTAAPANGPKAAGSGKAATRNRAAEMRQLQWLLGVAATLVAAAASLSGALLVLERLTEDTRAQWFGWFSPGPDPRLRVVVIDDAALETVGRWPWPRARLAAVIDELTTAGVKVVALDILLDNPQETRVEISGTPGPDGRAAVVKVRDDEVLAEAIRRHGRVVVAANFPFGARMAAGEQTRAVASTDAVREIAILEALGAINRLRAEGGAGGADAGTERRDVTEWDDDTLAARLSGPLLGLAGPVGPGPQREELLSKAKAALALLGKRGAWSLQMTPEALAEQGLAGSVTPSFAVRSISDAAAAIGNVSFNTFDPGGTTRRIPLWVESTGVLWPTLGLSAALLAEGHTVRDVQMPAGRPGVTVLPPQGGAGTGLELTTHRATLATGRYGGLMVVSWPRSLVGKPLPDERMPGWQWQFAQSQPLTRAEVPIGRVYEPVQLSELVRENVRAMESAVRAVLLPEGRKQLTPEDERAFVELISKLGSEAVAGPEWEAALEGLRPVLARAKTATEEFLSLNLDGVEEKDLPEEVRVMAADLKGVLATLPRWMAEIERGNRLVKEVRAELARRLGGSICFVGWTATGAIADFVPTSVSPKTPGVHVHVATANTVLTGFQRQYGPLWLDVFAIALLGWLGTLAGVRAGVVAAPLAAAGAAAGWFVVAGVGFWDYGRVIVSVTGPATAAVGSCAVVLLHRLVVEQRSRRRTEERFKSYLSPKVVDILVNNPGMDSFKPQKRELTVMFTDLAGFTTTAERLGGDRTAEILRQILGPMTDILQGESGTFNKYIGDAIMGFWGAPIEVPDHALRACVTAQKMLTELDRMNDQGVFGPDAGRLHMRIGIATGELMVGDFGNPPRNSDYTVIGDKVNLASRLEGANKAFDTRVLVDDTTRQQAAASSDPAAKGLRWRKVGNVLVKGKTEPMLLWEVVVRLGMGEADLAAWVEASDRAVGLFMEGRLTDAEAEFRGLQTPMGEDALVWTYMKAITAAATAPDSPEGAAARRGWIMLTEK